MPIALTRAVSPAIARCELTHLARVPIDFAVAQTQHAAYERRLTEAGCAVQQLASGADMPDSVFIEDTALVFDEIAVLTRPGAVSRRVETAAVAEALGQLRPLRFIEAPGTLDGGDVLVAGRRVFVGASSRTNAAAIEQLRRLLADFGYTVDAVQVAGCLHLKSAVTAVSDEVLLVNPQWVPREPFAGFELLPIDAGEPTAANALRVGETLIYPTTFPRTRERLEARGLTVQTVDVSELAKAEGAVTCCSLILRSA